MSSLQKNVASQNITFCSVSSTAGTASTSTSTSVITAFVSKDGTQGSAGGTFTCIGAGNGQWAYSPTQAETNCADFGLFITGTGWIPSNMDFHTDVVDSNALPSVNLVDIAGNAVATGTAQLGVNVVNIKGSASVGSAGYVGIDWAQITNPTNAQTLSATTISTSQAILSATSITSNVAGNVTGSVGSVVGAVGSVTGAVGSVTGNVGGNVVGTVTSVTSNVAGSVVGSVTSVTSNVAGSVVGSVASVTGNVAGSVNSVVTAVTVGTNNDKTGYALTATAQSSLADVLLDRDMSVGADSGSSSVRTPRQALRVLRNKVDVSSGTTLIVYKEDDATTSWTASVVVSSSAQPIVTLTPP